MSPKPRSKRQASHQEFLKAGGGGGDGGSKNPKGFLHFLFSRGVAELRK